MEYLYAILLLHSTKTELTEDNVLKVMKAADIEPDTERVKKLVASAKDIDIADAIQNPVIGQAPAPVAEVVPTPEPEIEEKDEKTDEEQAFTGLDVLFGNED